ncbi:MAG: ATP-binding protein [Bacteroidales bacterium]|nr:ATP-binding protein [Bacteroidales bacterium]
MIIRTKYINAIRPFIQKPVIKVITGVRRCGKSTLLTQIIDVLIDQGIDQQQIIYINKELFEFDSIRSYSDLHNYISGIVGNSKSKYYIFVDEIQEIDGWQRAVNSFLASGKYDIYITGSNANLLSSEIATLLSGRYIEFKLYTLSLTEFKELAVSNQAIVNSGNIFDLYIKYGGFPGLHHMEWSDITIRQYLQSLYNSVLLKDIVVKYNIRDAAMLEQIAEYLIDNTGNITTAKSISDYVKSQNRKVSVDTVQNYINYCMNALLVNKVKRYDLKGKRILETYEKYYMSDPGFRFATLGYSPDAISGQLENAVYLELLHRGYIVNIGKILDYEIDFVAQRGAERIYIQVCTTLNSGQVVDREYRSLELLNDHFPKLVLSRDSGFETNRKGIGWMNVEQFLLGE